MGCSQVAELCETANAKVGYDSVRIANYLCNGNYAISGGADGCQAAQDLAKSKGARMTVKLAVAGAFHTSYMQPAQEELEYAPSPIMILFSRCGRSPCLHRHRVKLCMQYCFLQCTLIDLVEGLTEWAQRTCDVVLSPCHDLHLANMERLWKA